MKNQKVFKDKQLQHAYNDMIKHIKGVVSKNTVIKVEYDYKNDIGEEDFNKIKKMTITFL